MITKKQLEKSKPQISNGKIYLLFYTTIFYWYIVIVNVLSLFVTDNIVVLLFSGAVSFIATILLVMNNRFVYNLPRINQIFLGIRYYCLRKRIWDKWEKEYLRHQKYKQ